VPSITRLCLHVGNPIYNSVHSVLGSPIPTLSLKLNLTLILILTLTVTLTLLTLTVTVKRQNSPLFRRISPQHHPNDAMFTSALYIRDYTGHHPVLSTSRRPVLSAHTSGSRRALRTRFPTCRHSVPIINAPAVGRSTP